MAPLRISADELYRRYVYCSFIKPEQITYFEDRQLVRVLFYRWDKEKENRRKKNFFVYMIECPLYIETVEFFSVSGFSLRYHTPEVEYYIDKIRLIKDKNLVRIDTETDLVLEMKIESWDVIVYPSESIAGRYTERVENFLFTEFVHRKVVLESPPFYD